ncbi:unnamed protein product [Polarella glacialis]|uniref:SAP domain-containing protein n=1 Tax=Polarella glacialis TaxID=89957 RepID=A0A813HMP0_POLGL|nr:unnamed protein product [Polarella glacialis]
MTEYAAFAGKVKYFAKGPQLCLKKNISQKVGFAGVAHSSAVSRLAQLFGLFLTAQPISTAPLLQEDDKPVEEDEFQETADDNSDIGNLVILGLKVGALRDRCRDLKLDTEGSKVDLQGRLLMYERDLIRKKAVQELAEQRRLSEIDIANASRKGELAEERERAFRGKVRIRLEKANSDLKAKAEEVERSKVEARHQTQQCEELRRQGEEYKYKAAQADRELQRHQAEQRRKLESLSQQAESRYRLQESAGRVESHRHQQQQKELQRQMEKLELQHQMERKQADSEVAQRQQDLEQKEQQALQRLQAHKAELEQLLLGHQQEQEKLKQEKESMLQRHLDVQKREELTLQRQRQELEQRRLELEQCQLELIRQRKELQRERELQDQLLALRRSQDKRDQQNQDQRDRELELERTAQKHEQDQQQQQQLQDLKREQEWQEERLALKRGQDRADQQIKDLKYERTLEHHQQRQRLQQQHLQEFKREREWQRERLSLKSQDLQRDQELRLQMLEEDVPPSACHALAVPHDVGSLQKRFQALERSSSRSRSGSLERSDSQGSPRSRSRSPPPLQRHRAPQPHPATAAGDVRRDQVPKSPAVRAIRCSSDGCRFRVTWYEKYCCKACEQGGSNSHGVKCDQNVFSIAAPKSRPRLENLPIAAAPPWRSTLQGALAPEKRAIDREETALMDWQEHADGFIRCKPCNKRCDGVHEDTPEHKRKLDYFLETLKSVGSTPSQPFLVRIADASFGKGLFLKCLLCNKWVSESVADCTDEYNGMHGSSGPKNTKEHAQKLRNLDSSRLEQMRAQKRKWHPDGG